MGFWNDKTTPMAYAFTVSSGKWITIVETRSFTLKAKKLFDDEGLKDLMAMLAQDPCCGVLLEGTGGIRKVRFGLEGRGKRGGARVVYYYHSDEIPLFLLTVFAKNEKDNLTAAERHALADVVDIIVAAYKGETS